ncbi:MAG: hypothetical protein KBS79_05445, partial [Lachnospiraceae bacterium]|nr:hypothetical protein [Candidatus Minthocola equi]
ILFFVFVALIIVGLLSCNKNTSDDPELNTSESETNEIQTGISSRGSIAIPGYEGLTLAANSKKQSIALGNPATNNCYFVISIVLEDGTLLWKSEEISPGNTSKEITLFTELEAGSYNVTIKYECYSMDKNRSPLNGAQILTKLRVK